MPIRITCNLKYRKQKEALKIIITDKISLRNKVYLLVKGSIIRSEIHEVIS